MSVFVLIHACLLNKSHLIDADGIDPDQPLAPLNTINRELALYKPSLSDRTQLIVLNKLDLPGAEQKAESFREALPDRDILSISAQNADGLELLKSKITQLLDGE